MNESLDCTGDSRRRFLAKLARAAVAAPLLVPFSTRMAAGIPPSTFCADQNITNCCALANCIVGEISNHLNRTAYLINTHQLLGPAARTSSLLKSLQKALEFMQDGIAEGNGDCTSAAARSKFTYAHGWIINFLETLADLPPSSARNSLANEVGRTLEAIDQLLNCHN